MAEGALSQHARWTVGVACALAFGAVTRYPGGTALDRTSAGYSLSRNFLSDLGMTVAYDGQFNRLGAGLFVLSLLVLVVGLGSVVITISRRLSGDHAARGWARFAVVLGVLACLAFVGVAVTPENRVMAVHVTFTQWAWRIIPLVAALLAVASFQTRGLRRAAVVWAVLAILMASYAALLSWGPSVATADGLVFQAVAQKIASVVVIAALLLAAREFDRPVR